MKSDSFLILLHAIGHCPFSSYETFKSTSKTGPDDRASHVDASEHGDLADQFRQGTHRDDGCEGEGTSTIRRNERSRSPARLRHLTATVRRRGKFICVARRPSFFMPVILHSKIASSRFRGKKGEPKDAIERTAGIKAVKRLFDELGVRYKDRNGGYTRIIRLRTKKRRQCRTCCDRAC